MSSIVMPLQSRRDHWTDGLTLNKHGVPLGNLRNVLHALRNAPEWHGVLAYDEFAARAITDEVAAVEQSKSRAVDGLPRYPHM